MSPTPTTMVLPLRVEAGFLRDAEDNYVGTISYAVSGGELIVKSANAHAALVDALQTAQSFLASIDWNTDGAEEAASDVIEQARSALALADAEESR